MSALGHKRTYAPQQAMSALHPIATAKADIKNAGPVTAANLASARRRGSLGERAEFLRRWCF